MNSGKFQIEETPCCVGVYSGNFIVARFSWADLRDAHERVQAMTERGKINDR